jgi:hypothetical protein
VQKLRKCLADDPHSRSSAEPIGLMACASACGLRMVQADYGRDPTDQQRSWLASKIP